MELMKIDDTLTVGRYAFSNAAEALIQPKEVIVVCHTMIACRKLMRRFLDSLWPSVAYTDWARLRVKLSYYEYNFINEDKLEIIVKSHHRPKVIKQEDFERALDAHAEIKKETICVGSV